MSDLPQADGRNASPSVSIVVPTYNRARFLARLLRALERQSAPSGMFDVIVVDDGSTDETQAVLSQSYRYSLRSLSQPNGGPAAARNAGIGLSSSELILFVDDDVIPSDDLVERHIEAHEGREVIVFGRMCPPADGRKQPFWAEWELRTLERQYQAMIDGTFTPTFRQFFTANASVRRADLHRAGLFNTTFRRAEDIELAYRLTDIPRDLVFAPQAVVVHSTPRTLDAWMRMARQYGHYDVALSRLPGRAWFADAVRRELLESRQTITRALVRLIIGRPYLAKSTTVLLRGALQALDAVGLRRLSRAGCSLLFSVLYWDEFCAEVGGRDRVWSEIAPSGAPLTAHAVE